jgi:hypothetical protein
MRLLVHTSYCFHCLGSCIFVAGTYRKKSLGASPETLNVLKACTRVASANLCEPSPPTRRRRKHIQLVLRNSAAAVVDASAAYLHQRDVVCFFFFFSRKKRRGAQRFVAVNASPPGHYGPLCSFVFLPPFLSKHRVT